MDLHAMNYGRAQYNAFPVNQRKPIAQIRSYSWSDTHTSQRRPGFTDGSATSYGQAYFPAADWAQLDWGAPRSTLTTLQPPAVNLRPAVQQAEVLHIWNTPPNVLELS